MMMLWAAGGWGIVMMRWSFKRGSRDGAVCLEWVDMYVLHGLREDYRGIQTATNTSAKSHSGMRSGSRITTDAGICSAR